MNDETTNDPVATSRPTTPSAGCRIPTRPPG